MEAPEYIKHAGGDDAAVTTPRREQAAAGSQRGASARPEPEEVQQRKPCRQTRYSDRYRTCREKMQMEHGPSTPNSAGDGGTAYRAVEGRSYTWGRKSDERFIKWITDTLESWTECERVIDAYLADRRPFFARHELRKLYANLAEFRQRAKPRAGASSGSQADTATVTIRVGSVPAARVGAPAADAQPAPRAALEGSQPS